MAARGETGAVASHAAYAARSLAIAAVCATRRDVRRRGQQREPHGSTHQGAGLHHAQDFCSDPTMTMGEVGWAEPASGSTVTAAALIAPPSGTAMPSTRVRRPIPA